MNQVSTYYDMGGNIVDPTLKDLKKWMDNNYWTFFHSKRTLVHCDYKNGGDGYPMFNNEKQAWRYCREEMDFNKFMQFGDGKTSFKNLKDFGFNTMGMMIGDLSLDTIIYWFESDDQFACIWFWHKPQNLFTKACITRHGGVFQVETVHAWRFWRTV